MLMTLQNFGLFNQQNTQAKIVIRITCEYVGGTEQTIPWSTGALTTSWMSKRSDVQQNLSMGFFECDTLGILIQEGVVNEEPKPCKSVYDFSYRKTIQRTDNHSRCSGAGLIRALSFRPSVTRASCDQRKRCTPSQTKRKSDSCSDHDPANKLEVPPVRRRVRELGKAQLAQAKPPSNPCHGAL
jgi:hypothetical protein